MSSVTSEHRITRRRGACDGCRKRKIRCNGATPCRSCEKNVQDCTYPALMPRCRKSSNPRVPLNWDILQTTSPGPPLTPLSSASCAWTVNEEFPWDAIHPGLLSEINLSSIETETETNVLNTHSIREEEGIAEINIQPSSTLFNSFEGPLTGIVTQSSPGLDPSGRDQQQTADHPPLLRSPNSAPSIDFSSATLYGLPPAFELFVPDSTSSMVARFLERLQNKCCGPQTDEKTRFRVAWNSEDDGFMRQWSNACFDDYPLNGFLEKTYSDQIIEKYQSTRAEALEIAFAQAIFALSCHASSWRQPSTHSPKSRQDATQLSHACLEGHRSIQGAQDSLLKLQVLLLLAIISNTYDPTMTGDILTGAVQSARALRLFAKGRNQPRIADGELDLAERAVKVLFCMETDQAINQGIPPLMNQDWLRDKVSEMTNPDYGAYSDLIANCLLFETLQSVLWKQYSSGTVNTHLGNTSLDHMKQLEINEQCLKDWATHHPSLDSSDQVRHADSFLSSLKSSDAGQNRRLFQTFCLYHKAVLFMFCPWIAALTDSTQDNIITVGRGPLDHTSRLHLYCLETSLDSAVALIRVAGHLTAPPLVAERERWGTLQAWQDITRLLPVALCVILFSMAWGDRRERLRAMPSLGTFGAILGGIGAPEEVGELLDEYFKVITTAGFA
ncbi:hypothetical protein F5Y15DRAFT_395025 [Xylariaceae sp. FL0016]|nr:hypothetical protein F5Y15DRAFT_395025 [Xylariaceae sp. FL0016]